MRSGQTTSGESILVKPWRVHDDVLAPWRAFSLMRLVGDGSPHLRRYMSNQRDKGWKT
jgi:hypothetical protein